MIDTDITIVLDRSGSMSECKSTTIEGFNTFARTQKEVVGEAVLTLVQFDDQYQVDYEGRSLHNTNYLNDETYVPRGLTALLDAIGKTIRMTENRVNRTNPNKIIFVIQTDGLENASKEYTKSQINEMISHLKNSHNWQFVFLGANQDAIKTADSYGIAKTHAYTYIVGQEINANSVLSASITSYRDGTTMEVMMNKDYDDN